MRTRYCGIFYFCIVVVFSLFYYGYWYVNPDSFIINSALNIHPFDEINDYLWSDSQGYEVNSIKNLNDLKNEYDNYYLDLNRTQSEIKDTKNDIDKIENEEIKLAKKRDIEIEKNIKIYKETQMSSFVEKETLLQEELSQLEKSLPIITKTESDIQLIRKVGDKRVELAEHRLIMAYKAVNVSEYILSNFGMFISQKTRDEYSELSEKKAQKYERSYQLEKKLRKVRSEAIDTIRTHIRSVRDRLCIIDFFYFSIGISTTTTFGDIVVNDKVIRALVSIQLILCIFVYLVAL